jgi:hypothetical protein
MTVAWCEQWVTIGRGHSPSAGRKVEAGPQVDIPRLKVATDPATGIRRWRGPEAAGRLQRADQDRDGGTQPQRASAGAWST